MKCHPTRRKALAHLQALEINVEHRMEAITLATSKYSVKKVDGNYCVCDEDGKPIKDGCHGPDGKDKAMQHMQEMMKGMQMENIQLAVDMKNPVWLGCAVTNRPHIRLKEFPLSIVEIDGKKFIRVPMMKAGRYKHPQGELDMTGSVLDAFIQNHEKGLADFEVVLDAKHQPDRGALGLFEKKHGGFVQREKADKPLIADPGGELLVSYGVPTGDDAVESVEKGRFRHASMEFHPNYSSNVEQTYLSSDMREVEEVAENIELGGPGSGRKGHLGGAFKKAYRAADKPFGVKRKLAKKGLGAYRKIGKAIAPVIAPGATSSFASAKRGAKAYGRATKANFKRIRKATRLEEEIFALGSLVPIYDELVDYIEQGQEDEFFWFDKDLFDFSEADLPEEDGAYKVDKQTAEEMLAALDEMALEPEYQHLFIEEELESEETMSDETAQELQVKIAQLEAQLAESNQRTVKLEKQSLESQVHALVLELKNLKDNGYGYTAETLNLVQSLMLGETIGEGDDTIKLEDNTNPADIATYYRKGMIKFMRSALVRAKVESTTIPNDVRVLEVAGQNGNEKFEAGKTDGKSFWSQMY